MDEALRYVLPAYLLAYFFAAFFWRSYRVWKATGVNPYVLGGGDSAHDFIGRMFRISFALAVAAVAFYAISPAAYRHLMPIAWLDREPLKWVGLGLLAASLVWTMVAQAQMGAAWRIGIDEKHRTGLVREGLFRFSRNPIFLGMQATLLGLFLALPNVLTLLVLVLGFTLIQIQVRLEEEHLTRQHGQAYEEYRRKVRRWL